MYNYTDHLGNVRLSYGYDPIDEVVKILEENNYYAYGLKHNNYNMSQSQYEKIENTVGIRDAANGKSDGDFDYKYNGKEWKDEFGLNVTAMDYRQYDNAIGRFNGMDALAESAFSVTPYHFCAGNPVVFGDPSGLRHGYTNSNNVDLNGMPDWAAAIWMATPNGTNSHWTRTTDGYFDNDDGTGYIDREYNYIQLPFALPELKVTRRAFWLGSDEGGLGDQAEYQAYKYGPNYQYLRDKWASDTLDEFQDYLGNAGLIPLAGEPFDIVNGIVSAGRGDVTGAPCIDQVKNGVKNDYI
ncbi:MAG: hypothetical protein PSV16_11400 [Flavobacterium sp.]|nr:hypothetical protein [Flavobacterium sp.]